MSIHDLSNKLTVVGVHHHIIIASSADFSDLQANDTVRVFHGTQNTDGGIKQFLKSGMDGTKVVSRSYNQGRERGLYVAPNQKTARDFGNIVIEFSVKAKDLYPTARWSLGAGHRVKEIQRMARERYPDSFRPLVSWQLSEDTEPQAMFLGYVPVAKIVAVYVYEQQSSTKYETLTVAEARKRFNTTPTIEVEPNASAKDILDVIASRFDKSVEDVIEIFGESDTDYLLEQLSNMGLNRKQTLRVASYIHKNS